MIVDGPVQNTSVEIWREVPGDFYADHIEATAANGITICVGGTCITKSVQDWHALSEQPQALKRPMIVEDDQGCYRLTPKERSD